MKKILIAAMVVAAAACQRKTDCMAVVHCNDVNDKPVTGAKVFLFANVKDKNNGYVRADLTATGNTDAEGKVSFLFKLPAIYDVSVSVGTQTASGIVKLEEGKTTHETVILK